MKTIELLPRWYSNEEKKAKTKECLKAKKELINSGLLNDKQVKELNTYTFDMSLIGDTYSRNYEIKILNKYINFVNRIK